MCNDNPYLPYTATIAETWFETTGERAVKTFKVTLDDEAARKAGATARASAPWWGCSAPVEHVLHLLFADEGDFAFSVMRAARLPRRCTSSKRATRSHARPYGNSFP